MAVARSIQTDRGADNDETYLALAQLKERMLEVRKEGLADND